MKILEIRDEPYDGLGMEHRKEVLEELVEQLKIEGRLVALYEEYENNAENACIML